MKDSIAVTSPMQGMIAKHSKTCRGAGVFFFHTFNAGFLDGIFERISRRGNGGWRPLSLEYLWEQDARRLPEGVAISAQVFIQLFNRSLQNTQIFRQTAQSSIIWKRKHTQTLRGKAADEGVSSGPGSRMPVAQAKRIHAAPLRHSYTVVHNQRDGGYSRIITAAQAREIPRQSGGQQAHFSRAPIGGPQSVRRLQWKRERSFFSDAGRGEANEPRSEEGQAARVLGRMQASMYPRERVHGAFAGRLEYLAAFYKNTAVAVSEGKRLGFRHSSHRSDTGTITPNADVGFSFHLGGGAKRRLDLTETQGTASEIWRNTKDAFAMHLRRSMTSITSGSRQKARTDARVMGYSADVRRITRGASGIATGMARGASGIASGMARGASGIAPGMARGASEIAPGMAPSASEIAPGMAPGILEIASGMAPKGYQTFQPVMMEMLAPPSYLNQYGMQTPISRMGGAAGMSGTQREANDFFRLRTAFDAQMSAAGRATPMQALGYPRSEITYKQNENDITQKLLSQQVAKPRAVDMQMKSKAAGEHKMSNMELSKLSDRLYDMLENRIRSERFRHGY